MHSRSLSCLAIVSVLALAGCNGERTPEQLVKQHAAVMDDFGDVLAKITDKASAEKHKGAVEKAVDKMNASMKEMEALPADKQKASDELAKNPPPEFEAAMSKMMKETVRIQMSEEIMGVLQPVFDKMGETK